MKMSYAENHLYLRKIIFDGDSICHATNESEGISGRGWAYRIGEKNGMEWYNLGIGGGTVTAEMYVEENGAPRHWISRNIDRIRSMHDSVDYLIFEGGTNDADLLGIDSERFGSLDSSDFSGVYVDSTFTGALEALFYKAINYYPTAKLGYIIPPRMGEPKCGSDCWKERRHYFMRAIEVCCKWGIPYIDLWESSTLNPALTCHYDPSLSKEENISSGKMYMDGQHLTSLGFDMISHRIEEWIRCL